MMSPFLALPLIGLSHAEAVDVTASTVGRGAGAWIWGVLPPESTGLMATELPEEGVSTVHFARWSSSSTLGLAFGASGVILGGRDPVMKVYGSWKGHII